MDQQLEKSNRPALRLGPVLALLLLFAVAVQAFCAATAAVPALDAVRFVDLAEQAGHRSCFSLWDATGQEPLYPVWLSAVASIVRWFSAGQSVDWALCVQLAAATPAVLCVIPVFLLSDRLVGRTGAIAGTLLFSTLPVVARLGAEGISDSLFLFFFSTSAWAAVAYFQARHRGWLIAAAVCAALATLTRQEGGLLIVILVGVLVFESQAARFLPSLRNIRTLTGNVATSALVLAIFCLCILPFRMPTQQAAPSAPPSPASSALSLEPSDLPSSFIPHPSSFSSPSAFAVKETSLRHRGIIAGSCEFAGEFAKAWNYAGVIGLAAGAWVLRKRAAGGERFVHVFSVCFAAVLLFFAIREGYLAARHLLPMVVLGAGCAAVGLMTLGGRFAWGVAVAVILAGLVQTAKPIHASRAGYALAGDWLAAQAHQGKVLDTKGWTRLFSGRVTYQYDEAKTAFGDAALAYVVVDPRELRHDSARANTLKSLLSQYARKAAEFPGRSPQAAVYRWEYPSQIAKNASAEAARHDALPSGGFAASKREGRPCNRYLTASDISLSAFKE